MKINYNKEDLIDLYLLDRLSPQERKDFEEEMRKDDALRKEVEAMQHIVIGFERKAEAEAVNAMHTLSEEQVISIIANKGGRYKRSAKKTRLFPVLIGVAAIIALLFYIGFQPKYSSEELYADFYTPFVYEYLPSRGGTLTTDQEDLLEQAIAEYNLGSYAKALALFDKMTANISAGQVPEEVVFYTALCLVQTGKESMALEKLESLVSLNDSEFRDDAQWSLALLYLKFGERKKCRNILYDILNNKNSLYFGDANRLFEKLEMRRWF